MSSSANVTNLVSNYTDNSVNWLLQSSIWSLRIVCPIFIILCPISNWACIRIFQSRIYARSSSKWYFISIAIFDTIYVLVTATLLFLITLNIYILNWNVLLCKSIVFFNYLSCQISAGLLVCLSIDRLIATSCLSLYRHTCTTQLSRIVCLIIILMFSILNCHYLIGYNIDSKGFCNIKRYRWYEENYTRLNIVYLLSYSIIPFTMITICNFLIVLSVCQNKTNMKRKYDMKKPILPSIHLHTITTSPLKNPVQICDKSLPFEQDPLDEQSKYEMLVSIKGEQVVNSLVDYNSDYSSPRKNRLSQNLLLHTDEPMNSKTMPFNDTQKPTNLPATRDRSSSSSTFVSSANNSQKMCVQLQITISLLAVSICFIFCTLPNCISTIMIQIYVNDERARRFWQAMNFFSIIPLLATHSVNLCFYYLSSNMFRERFKEYYFKKKTLY